MAELKLNNISGSASSNPLTFSTATTTTGSWASAPAFPTIASPDFAKVVVEPDTANEEIVYLTAYTAGATSGTFSRGQEGTTAIAHAGVSWLHGPTAADFAVTSVPIAGSRLLHLGHSLSASGGAVPSTESWVSALSGLLRSTVDNMAVGGAVLAFSLISPSTNGYPGIGGCLQNVVPFPQSVRWRGAWSSATYYATDDGVTSAVSLSCTTTNGSATLTTSGSFTTSGVVAGMVVTGTNIPLGTTVLSVQSATSLTLSQNATGSATNTITFTGWYRSETTNHGGSAPTGTGSGSWRLVTQTSNMGTYKGLAVFPIVGYGNNDLGRVYQHNYQPFLSALETLLSILSAAVVWQATDPTVVLAGGTFTTTSFSSVGAALGAGTGVVSVPNTAGATITTQTPPDWPGGHVDFIFGLGVSGSTFATGTLDFTVDGSAVNVVCSGVGASNGGVVNFGSPNRQHIEGTALTTALAAGVAVTSLAVNALPAGLASGDTITVGVPGTTDTFSVSATTASGATSIPVTSHAPTYAHAVGDQVYPSSTTQSGWAYYGNNVVRVPVPAGSHQVQAAVPSSPNIANLYFNSIILESPAPPAGIVLGLFKPLNYQLYWPAWPSDANVDSWNAQIASMVGPGNEFSQFTLALINTLRPYTTLTTALTAGQTGITSLAVAPLTFAIAAGDSVAVGSGPNQQNVVASAAASIGATSISVQSFTSTYAHPIGDSVWDLTSSQRNFYYDGVHPNLTGQDLLASAVCADVLAATSTASYAQLAAQSRESQPRRVMQVYSGGNIIVGTGVANGWGKVGGAPIQLSIAAEPGDELVVEVAGIWDTSSTVQGYLDIVTYNPSSITAISFFSGSSVLGPPYFGNVGAQFSNGLSVLKSTESITSVTEKISGRFHLIVQAADIIDGYVYLTLWGKSSSTTARHIVTSAGTDQFIWYVENRGPVSAYGEV